MSTKNVSRRSHVAQPTKYVWVAAATLIAALVLGVFVAAPPALATDAPDSDLPFGLQPGLVTARGVGYVPPLDLVGGPGLPFGLQSGLVTAHLDSSGRLVAQGDGIQGIDASSARWSALGKYYTAQYERAAAANSARYSAMAGAYTRGIDASSARWSAMARAYTGGVLAENPELMFARKAYITQTSLAANPELTLARSFYSQAYVSCSLTSDKLAANPELAYVNQALSC